MKTNIIVVGEYSVWTMWQGFLSLGFKTIISYKIAMNTYRPLAIIKGVK